MRRVRLSSRDNWLIVGGMFFGAFITVPALWLAERWWMSAAASCPTMLDQIDLMDVGLLLAAGWFLSWKRAGVIGGRRA